MKSKKFDKNIELDARMVLASMNGGMDGLMNWAFSNRKYFPTTKVVTDRAEWLKKQSEQYIIQVSNRTAELERKQK